MPPLVFLDDPYVGMDVMARRKILKVLNTLKMQGRNTIVLSSHNMEDAEYSCDRITIMVSGRMECLGSIQHLKEKFCKGYRLEFLLKRGGGHDPAQFVTAVLEQFPGIKLSERHDNMCIFILDDKLPWSKIFNRVEKLKNTFTLEHFVIGEHNLEKIFLALAKVMAENEVAADNLSEQPSLPLYKMQSGQGKGQLLRLAERPNRQSCEASKNQTGYSDY
ncbi:ATP-binding cassette sub-family A member 9-like [Haemaphysalis longicornis]